MKRSWFILICLVVASCSKETDSLLSETDLGYSYFPILEVGDVHEYDITITIYSNEGKNVDIKKYFQKEEVVESEGEIGGDAFYRRDIYTKDNSSQPWEYSHSQLVEINALQVIIHHGGERIIHMQFPTEIGKKWDGLSFIDQNITREIGGEHILFYKDWNFELNEMNATFEEFNYVINIQQANHENEVGLRYSIEKYADDIGLVYKEQKILDTQCLSECQGLSWEEKAHKGIILTKRLVKVN